MAEIKVERAKLQQIRDQLPEMSSVLKKDMNDIATSLEIIKKNIDSDGINTILSKFNTFINTLTNDLVVNINTAHDYLNNKLAGYQSVASKTDEQLSRVNALLEEMEK